MQLLRQALQLILLTSTITSVSAASWGFSDATVSIQHKGAGVGKAVQEKLNENSPLSKPISLGDADILRLALTTKEGSSKKRPHQAFLLLKDSKSGLDYSYPLGVKDSGKSKVEISQKDLPLQFLSAVHPLDAEIVIGSFGSSKGYHKTAFQLNIVRDPSKPVKEIEIKRYAQLPEIHHIFKPGPSSPPIMIPALFVLAVVFPLPLLLSSWSLLSANLNHVSTALKSAPFAHSIFVSSILGMEGIFFMYYTSWNLFQALPPAFLVGTVAYISGSRALSEVQERRLAGLR